MGKKKKSEANFLVQGSILAAASIISRIIGLLYRVPLTGIIGNKGNSYYSCAFEIYSMMLLISSYSLPLAVSKLVSARVAKGERRNAYRVFKGALLFAIISGTLSGTLVFVFADALTKMMSTPPSIYALKVLAPTLLIVAVSGVFRGFFQGLGTMMPSAISQIIEQIINAVMSVWAAYMLYAYGERIGAVLGDKELYGSAYGAAGGTIGTGAGALAALLFMAFIFFSYRPFLRRQMKRDKKKNREGYGAIFTILFMTIIPVLLSTTIYNISSIVDQGIYKNISLSLGASSDNIDEWWGIFSGKYKVLINVPLSIASAMAASCVPSLTAAFSQRDRALVNRKINSSVRFIMVIAFPCAVGMAVLAAPILQLLRLSDASGMPQRMIQLGAISVIFYSLSTLSNALLQGINKMNVPVRNAVIALILHLILLVVLLYTTQLGIYTVVIANTFFAFVMCILNSSAIHRYARYHQEIVKTFIIPGIASVVMGAVVFGVYKLLMFTGINAIATIASIGVGAVVYGVALLLMRGLTEDELLSFPKGHLLVKVARKAHLL